AHSSHGRPARSAEAAHAQAGRLRRRRGGRRCTRRSRRAAGEVGLLPVRAFCLAGPSAVNHSRNLAEDRERSSPCAPRRDHHVHRDALQHRVQLEPIWLPHLELPGPYHAADLRDFLPAVLSLHHP
ncbi:unnamed protein product, partial [Prorocentrum cordatum]